MADKIIVISIIFFFGFAALLLSKKLGKKTAELNAEKERVKNEQKEKARANRIIDNLRNYSDDDIDRRLLYIKNNKR